jgi:hypothetical protein
MDRGKLTHSQIEKTNQFPNKVVITTQLQEIWTVFFLISSEEWEMMVLLGIMDEISIELQSHPSCDR